MEYKVNFYEEAVSCVDSITFEVDSENDLFDQCETYVNEVLFGTLLIHELVHRLVWRGVLEDNAHH